MILPSKHISPRESILGVGGAVLVMLDGPMTMTSLWEKVRDLPQVGTYQRFVLTLDLLFLIGAVEMHHGLLTRRQP